MHTAYSVRSMYSSARWACEMLPGPKMMADMPPWFTMAHVTGERTRTDARIAAAGPKYLRGMPGDSDVEALVSRVVVVEELEARRVIAQVGVAAVRTRDAVTEALHYAEDVARGGGEVRPATQHRLPGRDGLIMPAGNFSDNE